jgi:hypothetical protein
MLNREDKVTHVWTKYKNGVEHHNKINLYSETTENNNFYSGNQWYDIKHGSKKMIALNFIKPIVKYKTAIIAQNRMISKFSDTNNNSRSEPIIDMLNTFFEKQWEKSKFDSKSWNVIKRACITGNSYVYGYNDIDQNTLMGGVTPNFKHQLIETTNIYFSDEQNKNINEQSYIIIAERLPVSKVREIAKENKISSEDIKLITSDETNNEDKQEVENEVKTELGKCTSLLYFEMSKEGLKFCRSVKGVIYIPEQTIQGLDVYPIVGYGWEEEPHNARAVSEVHPLVPAQREVNSTAFRRSEAVNTSAYPVYVYDSNKVVNPEELYITGKNIAIDNLALNPLKSVIDVLQPQKISPDAANLQTEILTTTRDLAGAGDAATGQIDPTKASGESIKAARDQSAVPLNEQISSYKQFIEDISMMWYKMLIAYSDSGIMLPIAQEDGTTAYQQVTQEDLKGLDVDITIDVSPIDPYSRMSREIALTQLFQSGTITFEEYVELLDDTSSVPKADLEKIIKKRVEQGIPPNGVEELEDMSQQGGMI